MQTTRREINSFIARKSFKYNDVINSKIVNLDIWYHFWLLNESSRELESNSDSRSISSQVKRLILSNRVKSEDWYRVIELSQNVDMKTQLDDQFSSDDALALLQSLLLDLCLRSNNALALLQSLLLDLRLRSDDALALLQNLLLDLHLRFNDALALLQNLLLDLRLRSDDAFTLLRDLLLDLRSCSDNALTLLRNLLLDLRLCIKLCSHFIVILALKIDALFSWNRWILVD